ncbi:MAG: hypothetical protein HY549_12845 [Elusimicrobia bacterium]|nr:hypothetical protein [Elusimicrobiota bacterium]
MRVESRLAFSLLALLSCPAQAGDGPGAYLSPSGAFSCDIPAGWNAFAEPDFAGQTVRIVGPDGPSGLYRAGIDVRWHEKGQPGFIPAAKALERWRAPDPRTGRSASAARPLRISGILARAFELVETRRLPLESLPALEEELHHYVAVLPRGEGYYVIRLSSSRESYLDYRKLFFDFLRSFKLSGTR